MTANPDTLQEITPRPVRVQQRFLVVLERMGKTYNHPTCTATMHYGRRPNGQVIYSVPVFVTKNGKEFIGKAISTGFSTPDRLQWKEEK